LKWRDFIKQENAQLKLFGNATPPSLPCGCHDEADGDDA
jgi:hypothetical protein